MADSNPVSVFPPEVWCIITERLTDREIASLILMGSRLLSQKLAEGGVTTWNMRIGPHRIASRASPMLVRELRRLKSFSLLWDPNYCLKMEIDGTMLEYFPKTLQKLELICPGASSPFSLDWSLLATHFPGLHTLRLSYVVLGPAIPSLKHLENLETVDLNVTNFVLTDILLSLPTSVTSFCYHVPYDIIVPYSMPVIWDFPQLRTLKLTSSSVKELKFDGILSSGVRILPLTLTCLHYESPVELMDVLMAEGFPESLLDLSIPEFPWKLEERIINNPIDTVLPRGLTRLSCAGDWSIQPSVISKLPRSLLSLHVDSFGGDKGIWDLPPHLEVLTKALNSLLLEAHISEIPSSLQSLNIYDETVLVIKLLPAGLKSLDCRLDPENIPFLPPLLTFMDIYIPSATGCYQLPPLPRTLTHLACTMVKYYPFTFFSKSPLKRLRIGCSEDLGIDWASDIPSSVTSLDLGMSHCKADNYQLAMLPCMPQLRNLSLDFVTSGSGLTTAAFAYLGPQITTLKLHLHSIDQKNCPALPKGLERLFLTFPHEPEAQELDALFKNSISPSSVGIVSIKPIESQKFSTLLEQARINPGINRFQTSTGFKHPNIEWRP